MTLFLCLSSISLGYIVKNMSKVEGLEKRYKGRGTGTGHIEGLCLERPEWPECQQILY